MVAYTDIIFALAGVALGLGAGLYVIGQRKFNESDFALKAEKKLAQAMTEAKSLVQAAKTYGEERKKQFEVEQKEYEIQLEKMEKIMEVKAFSFQKREGRIAELKRALEQEEKSAHELRAQASALGKEISNALIRITGITPDRAKQDIISFYEEEFKKDAELRLAAAEQWNEECAVRDARAILADIMMRYADSTSVEHEEKNIIVQRDEIKGRIIGRSAAAIAFFEEHFGVDVIFNDEPNTIIISCFNLVQREVARCALERLMREKIINEEMIMKVKPLAEQDVDKILMKEGDYALKKLGLSNMQPDFVKLVGRLVFRTSYGQNIMRHCFEVGYFARLIASEIGANTETAFLGGFFHDIGKAIDQEVGGSHDVLSKEILEKYGFSWEITHAAWTHHNAAPQETVEARIVQAADAISASRPGARAESVERYLAKINELQDTALSFEGVRKAYAINAGREVRVVVDPEKISDNANAELAQNIAAKVQEKGGYPGKIKVTTIRTTKVTDYAR